jgi:hypothetical protein
LTVATVETQRDEPTTAVEKSLAIVADRGRFTTSAAASNSFAAAANLLLDETRSCSAGRNLPAPSCIAVSNAFALAQTAAATALDCTQPGVFELRTMVASYLKAIDTRPVRSSADVPPIPTVPKCA